jgi:hypothetical protein
VSVLSALLLSVAFSADAPSPDDLDDVLDTLGKLQPAVDLVRPIDEPFTVTEGPLVLSFDSGWIIPVFAGAEARALPEGRRNLAMERLQLASEGLDGSLIGFAWVGEGTATMYFAREGEALRFANRQVRNFGSDADEMRAIAHREKPFTTVTDRGFVIGEVPGLFDLIWPEGPPDPNEIFAYTTSAAARRAADTAATTLMNRVKVYDRYYGDFQRELGWLRLAGEFGDGGHTVFTDVRTDHRFGVVDPPTVPATPEDRWLGTLAAAPESTYIQIVQSLGVLHDQSGLGGIVHTGGLRPTVDEEDWTSAPARPTEVVPGKAHADVYVQREPGGNQLQVETRTTLEFTARGGDIAWVDLDLSALSSETFEISWLRGANDEALAHSTRPSFETLQASTGNAAIQAATSSLNQQALAATSALDTEGMITGVEGGPDVSGFSATTTDVVDAARAQQNSFIVVDLLEEEEVEIDDVRRRGTFRVVLPEPLKEGETTSLQFWWKDAWSLRNGETCMQLGDDGNNGQIMRATGSGTGARALFPGMPGISADAPFDTTVRLLQPADDPLEASIPGEAVGDGTKDVWRYTDYALGGARDARVAFGKWSDLDRPAKGNVPDLSVRLRKSTDRALRTLPRELEQIFGYFGAVLPEHPFDALHVVEGPPRCDVGLRWPTSHEMIELYQAVTPDAAPVSAGALRANNFNSPRDLEPALESHRLAAAIARGYWFHDASPASDEDAWLNHALTWGMACMYVGAAHGPKACDQRLNQSARAVSRPREAREAHPLTLPDNGARFRREGLGPYLLFHMLRLRLGNDAFFGGLQALREDHPGEGITTDRLRTYLERSSGANLAPFFDYWV